MKIIVTGSLGHIGKPLTQELVQKGHAVTVISSRKEKQKDIEALGATAAIGKLEDVDFLTNTFAGADAAFCMMPPSYATEADQMGYYRRTAENYSQAIQQSKIRRVVLLSSYGADLESGTGMILGSHYAENILNKVPGISLTILRPGYFYYNLNNFMGMIKHAGFIGANYGGDDKLILVAPVDIAIAAAEELTSAVSGTDVRYVASDEHTCNKIANALGAAIGKPDLQWKTLTDEQTKQGMVQQGMSSSFADLMVELGAAQHAGILQQDYLLYKPITMGKVKLEDFAREFAEGFNKQ